MPQSSNGKKTKHILWMKTKLSSVKTSKEKYCKRRKKNNYECELYESMNAVIIYHGETIVLKTNFVSWLNTVFLLRLYSPFFVDLPAKPFEVSVTLTRPSLDVTYLSMKICHLKLSYKSQIPTFIHVRPDIKKVILFLSCSLITSSFYMICSRCPSSTCYIGLPLLFFS